MDAISSQFARRNSVPGKKVGHLIIGSGVAGILMAIKLRERGDQDFVILEKADRLGGTWRDNRYPGVACDVAAHLYVYSFAPNPAWRTRYARGADIWNYYHQVARRYGVLPHIRYRHEVVSAEFQDGTWRVECCDGTVYVADYVIAATGRLHHPKLPDIAGAETFAGTSFHTARWDETTSLAGKRVGLIGTGSTATQIVASSAAAVDRLTIFQRTPQWVYTLPNTPIPWWRRALFRLSPGRLKRYYLQLQHETEQRGQATTGIPEARLARDQVCYNAVAAIRDPVLRAKLTPDYEVGCKRLVFSPDFYEAVQHRNVDVVTDAIERIEPRGIVTADGKVHELDVLVYATGFDAHAYLRPMKATGLDGVTLDQLWAEFPQTYRSMSVPQLPNFFIINGPYSPGGTASVVGIVEIQVNYILQLLDRAKRDKVMIVPKTEAAMAWLENVRDRARNTLWGTGGCKSWYLDHTGTPVIDPTTLGEFAEVLATPAWQDYLMLPRAATNGEAASVVPSV